MSNVAIDMAEVGENRVIEKIANSCENATETELMPNDHAPVRMPTNLNEIET